MPICGKCHKFKKRSLIRRHEKNCMPSDEDLDHFRVCHHSNVSKRRKRE
jgi:hypothetical protein